MYHHFETRKLDKGVKLLSKFNPIIDPKVSLKKEILTFILKKTFNEKINS